MLPQEELDRLVDAMLTNGVTYLAIDGRKINLRIALDPSMAEVGKLAERVSGPVASRARAYSPGIGIFHPRGYGDGLTALAGDAPVARGDVVGYLSQGSLRIPIVAPTTGKLASPLPADGSNLGYRDVVIEMEAEA
jgi:hypothetical protein